MLAAIAGAPAAVKGVKSAVKYFDSYDHAKDELRQQTNARAYALAAATPGNVEAFKFLKGMSGKYGSIPQGPVPNVTDGGFSSGWASPPAREDALRKYRALAPRYETGASVAIADPDGRTSVGGVDPVTGQPTSAVPAPLFAGMGPALLLIGALVVVAMLSKSRG